MHQSVSIRSKGPRAARAGQALVEFALILPVLVLLFAAVVDFGWLIYQNICMSEACRAGAELAMYDYGTATQKTADIKERIIKTAAAPQITADEITVDLASTMNVSINGTATPCKAFRITVAYNHQLLIAPLFTFASQIPIVSSVRSLVVTGMGL